MRTESYGIYIDGNEYSFPDDQPTEQIWEKLDNLCGWIKNYKGEKVESDEYIEAVKAVDRYYSWKSGCDDNISSMSDKLIKETIGPAIEFARVNENDVESRGE